MNSSLFAYATLLSVFGLYGCSQQQSASAAAATAATAASPTDDPCALVTDTEVRQQFPDAASGQRGHSLDQYGIATCTWNSSANTLIVQIFKAKGSVEDELRSRMSGNLDPLTPGAGAQVQYKPIGGVSDQAMLVVEKADAKRGILADTAVLVARRGERMAVLFTGALIDGERAPTAKALEALGRSAAGRL
ncbi:MAG: hypothetical protein ABI769_06255 [Pseudomonadota bacterium]